MRNRYYRGTVEDTKCILGYLLSRYKTADNPIRWLRERVEIIPPKVVWK